MDEIEGTVLRLVYRNPDNGYTVVKLDERGFHVTAVGTLPDVAPGVELVLRGHWTTHPQYGRQFEIEEHEVALPETEAGIEAYLSSGLIQNVGPVSARLIVERFGRDTLRVLDEEPGRLQEVSGIGPGRAGAIAESWRAHRGLGQLMMDLHGYGISTSIAVRVHQEFGPDASTVLKQDPYRLTEIRGIGFKRADRVARSMGMKMDSPARIEAGLLHVLQEQAQAGHTYVTWSELKEQTVGLLDEIVAPHLKEASRSLQRKSRIETDGSKVYLAHLWDAETDVAGCIRSLMDAPGSIREARKLAATGQNGIELSRQQLAAVEAALNHKVTVLTGGPGTGKTVTTKAVVAALEGLECRYALCAPTGRAAKRLAEVTGRPAQTIHRLLEFNPAQGFGRNALNPLDVDYVVVDESSMLDVQLTAHLLRAVPASAHVLFVGDVDQLPSVGPGNVLQDLIGSGKVTVVRLTEVFRQAAGSGIVVNAHRVNAGDLPICNDGFGDFYLFTKADPAQMADLVVDIVAHRIPRTFGIAPGDVQVLAPMYRGECGIANLNVRLQAALNTPSAQKAERKSDQRVFREGDRVMQTQNDYEKGVYNGDVGLLVRIDPVERRMFVMIDGRLVSYDWHQADELVHAYAMSIHKSQGSEYPAIVVPVTTQHYVMLQRNLLYTAITRARKLVVLVGTWKAIAIAARNARVRERHSGLLERLLNQI